MQKLLLELLIGLKRISDVHGELLDSEVRERIGEAIMQGFIRAVPDYVVPNDLGMLTQDANSTVQALIVSYIENANKLAAELEIVQFHDRLAAFQDDSVFDSPTEDYELFFGHTPPEWYDSNGDVIWDRVR